MNYRSLLRKPLKSDEIIDLLETYDIEVVYDFDRLHENMPDQYWATCHELGIQIKFDETQILETIFIFLTAVDGFSSADLSNSDILLFDSKQAVRDYASKNKVKFTEGEASFLGEDHDWIRFDYPDHRVHYDFSGSQLKKVSLSIHKNTAEQGAAANP